MGERGGGGEGRWGRGEVEEGERGVGDRGGGRGGEGEASTSDIGETLIEIVTILMYSQHTHTHTHTHCGRSKLFSVYKENENVNPYKLHTFNVLGHLMKTLCHILHLRWEGCKMCILTLFTPSSPLPLPHSLFPLLFP